jgi:transcriptional regulator with XRE-family HTH domain
MSKFSEWLHTTRVQRRLGVNELGEASGTSPSAISKIESNQRNPSSHTVRKLAAYFNVNEDWLLGLAGHRKEIDPPPPQPDLAGNWQGFSYNGTPISVREANILDTMLRTIRENERPNQGMKDER